MGGVYYVNIRCPAPIRKIVNREFIRHSLRTRCRVTALERARVIKGQILRLRREIAPVSGDEWIDGYRKYENPILIRHAVVQVLRELGCDLPVGIDRAGAVVISDGAATENDRAIVRALFGAVRDRMSRTSNMAAGLKIGEFHVYAETNRELITLLDREDVSEALEDARAALTAIQPAQPATAPEIPKAELLDNAIGVWREELQLRYKNEHQKIVAKRPHMRAFEEVAKYVCGADVTLADLVDKRLAIESALMNYPARMPGCFADLYEPDEEPEYPTLKNTTLHAYKKTIKQFSAWFSSGRYVESVRYDPFTDLFRTVPNEPMGSRLFEAHELDLLFGPDGLGKVVNAAHYFVPLIGIYSGMRCEEICQLSVSDVMCNDQGQWYFNLHRADGRRIKNDSSVRYLPVHPAVVEAGFIEYWTYRADAVKKVAGDRGSLFGFGCRNDRHGFDFSCEIFPVVLESLGIWQAGRGMHGLRHTFATRASVSDVPDSDISKILGHKKSASATTAGYIHQSVEFVAQLYPSLEKVQFDFDLAPFCGDYRN